MSKESILFCFKGDRDYIHGTDIFNKVIELIFKKTGLKIFENIDMSIHNISKHNLTIIDNDDEIINEQANIIFSTFLNGKQIRLHLIETDQNVECRYEYAEEKIVEAANYNETNKEIILRGYNDFTLIEKIVALNKGLLQKVFPNLKGKWYFTRIKFNQLNPIDENNSEIKIVFKRNLQFKLTNSFIYFDNNFVGNIYFSLL